MWSCGIRGAYVFICSRPILFGKTLLVQYDADVCLSVDCTQVQEKQVRIDVEALPRRVRLTTYFVADEAHSGSPCSLECSDLDQAWMRVALVEGEYEVWLGEHWLGNLRITIERRRCFTAARPLRPRRSPVALRSHRHRGRLHLPCFLRFCPHCLLHPRLRRGYRVLWRPSCMISTSDGGYQEMQM